MSASFLGIGWKFPVSLENGRVDMAVYEESIRESIWIVLATARGERKMRPDFGCGIHDLVFEEINATTLASIESTVREALITYEPRIELNNVTVDPSEALDGMLVISIDYRLRRTNQEDNLVYPFFFREGGER